jgi:tetratricopeptide (TPR) repeat protein
MPKWLDVLKSVRVSLRGGSLKVTVTVPGESQGPESLNRRIHHLEKVIAGTPVAANAIGSRNNLGNSYRDRYLVTGEVADLERAIRNYEEGIATAPATAVRELGTLWGNVGVALVNRYQHLGDLADLERAIEGYREALSRTAEGSADQGRHLANLSDVLVERYRRTRQRHELDAGIDAGQKALSLAEPGSRAHVAAEINLAGGLIERYLLTVIPSDISDAIRYLDEAQKLATPGSPEAALARVNLAGALIARVDGGSSTQPADAQTNAGLDYVDQVIRVLRSVETDAPAGLLSKHAALSSLGQLYWRRYQHTQSAADLDAAIDAYQKAVQHVGGDMVALPIYLNELGIVSSERFALSDDPRDAVPALDAWRRALSLLRTTFAEVPVAIKLGQQRVSSRLGVEQRVVALNLMLAQRAPQLAAASLREAMIFAETAKSRLLTELVGRADVMAPAAVPAEDLAHERDLLTELSALDAQELAGYGSPQSLLVQSNANVLKRRRGLLDDLAAMWTRIAVHGPEASDYVALRRGDPLSWEDLSELASMLGPDTALASMFSTNSRSVLFILRAGWDTPAVAEVAMNQEELTNLLQRFQREVVNSSGEEEWTWDQPLLQLLMNAAPHLNGVARLLLVPIGWSLSLPWSALAIRAGLLAADGGPMPVVILPAAAILPRLRHRVSREGGDVLVIGNPSGDLPDAEQEACLVSELFAVTPLIGSSATKEQVLARLPGTSIAHFASHALFERDSPLDSRIELADGVLTAREVLARSLQTELLVLSGCETGVAEPLGGEELAGISQAFMQAGARSMLVSLWEVDDEATRVFMSAFYTAYKEGMDKASAMRSAMIATRQQAGDDPYYWGAFALIGDWER